MVRKEMEFDKWHISVDCADYFDVNDQTNITESDYKRYARMLDEDPFDDDYKILLSILTKKPSTKPLKKRREKDYNAPEINSDCYTDEKETNDRAYGLWLKQLIEDDKSSILKVEGHGLPFLKYEGDGEGSDNKECEFSDYKRKLRNGSKKYYGPSSESRFTSSDEEVKDLGRRKLRDRSKKKGEPSSESRFILREEEAEDSGRGKMRSGAKKNSWPSNESRFTSSEEEAEDSGWRKLRSGSEKNNRSSDESRFASSEEEAEDSAWRKLRGGSKKNSGPLNESRFTLSEKAEDSGRRKLRSGSIKNHGPSYESRFTSSEEAEDSGRRKLRSGGAKSEKMERGETSSIETEPDYHVLLRGVKCVEGWTVFEDTGDRVVLEESNGRESNHQRDDEWGPFVEILDRASFYKEVDSSPAVEAATDGLENTNKDNRYSNLGTQFEFRRQLIAVLRKPYDKEEYNKLWEDIKFRKPEKRHLDLRHGRDRSCSMDKYGKSYLDHHPDLKKQLSLLGDDNKPTRLNLLRGFFFWLKKASHNGSFHPWRDSESLAIIPESG